MSQSLPPNLVKATTGQYSIPIRAIFSEAWHRIKGMKKSFWGGLGLLFLGLFSICLVFFLLNARGIGQFIFEALRPLVSVALVFLALQHLRHQAIYSTMVFEFRKAWKPLVIMLIFYAIAIMAIWLLFFLSTAGFIMLTKVHGDSLRMTFAILFIPLILLFTYISILIRMSMLLILDKKMSLKQSVVVAFKSINQHVFKNIALLLLASLLFLGIGLVTLGIGLIWLLPFMSLISAIQYQRIFCQEESALGAR